MLVPPANFGIAEEGVYRCSHIETLNLPFLETLDLHTILYVGGQEPSNFMEEFFTRNSIEWFVLNSPAYVDVVPSLSTNGKGHGTTTTAGPNGEDGKTSINNNSGGGSGSDGRPTSLTGRPNGLVQQIQPSGASGDSSSHSRNTDVVDRYTTRGDISNNSNRNRNTVRHNDRTGVAHLGSQAEAKSKSKAKISYRLSDSDSLMLIKSDCIKKVFYKLLNKDNYNLLLVDRTGLIIGMLRKIQKWNLSSIINEYRLYTGKNRSYFSETFLELISIKLTQESSIGRDTSKSNETVRDTQQSQRSHRDKGASKARRNRDDGNNDNDNNNNNSANRENYMVTPIIFVNEEDLCKPIEIPDRLIKIIEEAEQRDRAESLADEANGPNSSESHRSGSNLGIFGHRYRLAFNKRENGLYDYYRPGVKPKKGDEDQNAVVIKIPAESKLPEWFKWQRDIWEQENSPEEHHFYRESIFI